MAKIETKCKNCKGTNLITMVVKSSSNGLHPKNELVGYLVFWCFDCSALWNNDHSANDLWIAKKISGDELE